MPADPGREAVSMSRLHEGPADMSVARFSDAARMGCSPRWSLPRGPDQDKPSAVLGSRKRLRSPISRDGRRRNNRGHAPQGLESLDHRIQTPFGKELRDLIRQTSGPLCAYPDGCYVFLQHDLLGG